MTSENCEASGVLEADDKSPPPDGSYALSAPHTSSNTRLSAQAAPWYPLANAAAPTTHHTRDVSSTSSQPRREDEFPGTPVDFIPAMSGSGRRLSQHPSASSTIDLMGGVSPVASVALAFAASRGGRSPSSSTAGSTAKKEAQDAPGCVGWRWIVYRHRR